MSDNPELCANYLRIVRLIVEIGTKVVRDLFYFYKPSKKVDSFFATATIIHEISELKRKHIITAEQFKKLISYPNPDEFDLSLLITLIVNLFKWTVEEPKTGWNKPVSSDDTTLGAILLRLKTLRNCVIAHSIDANLTKEIFDKYWEEAEICIRCISEYIGNDTIENTLQWYKSSPLDDKDGCTHIILVRQWYKDGITILKELQNEVERLCKCTNEFGLFFKSNIPERYKRYVLLLNEGGLLVLADVLRREMGKANTDLNMLLDAQQWPNKETMEKDISKWGLKKLADIIVKEFQNLSSVEVNAISSIGNAYADYSKIAMVSLDSDKFRPYWTEIVSNLYILSAGLDAQTQVECHRLIRMHDTEDVNEDAVKLWLFQMQHDCLENSSLVQQYIDAKDKLKIAVEQMEREGVFFGHNQVIELKMMTHGKSKEKRILADKILSSVWEKAISMSNDPCCFPEIEDAVTNILEGIKRLPDAKVKCVENHCIILVTEVSSYSGLLSLLNFVDSTLFMTYMQSIQDGLSNEFGNAIMITTFITVESIVNATQKLSTETSEGQHSIGIQLSCLSIDGARAIRDIVKSSKTTNNVNLIAQTLSNSLEEKISVKASLDMAGLEDVDNYKGFDCFISSEWTPFMLPPVGDKIDQFQPSDASHLSSILKDIVNMTGNRSMCNFSPIPFSRSETSLNLMTELLKVRRKRRIRRIMEGRSRSITRRIQKRKNEIKPKYNTSTLRKSLPQYQSLPNLQKTGLPRILKSSYSCDNIYQSISTDDIYFPEVSLAYSFSSLSLNSSFSSLNSSSSSLNSSTSHVSFFKPLRRSTQSLQDLSSVGVIHRHCLKQSVSFKGERDNNDLLFDQASTSEFLSNQIDSTKKKRMEHYSSFNSDNSFQSAASNASRLSNVSLF